MPALTLDTYKDTMRENICAICVSFAPTRDNPTRCVHETSGDCSLFAHLPDVVHSISAVDSGSIEPYLTALRHNVCANCSHQNKDGVCDVRDNRGPVPVWCALDTYFNLIVGTIEDLHQVARKGQEDILK
jgi:hypothetical protein